MGMYCTVGKLVPCMHAPQVATVKDLYINGHVLHCGKAGAVHACSASSHYEDLYIIGHVLHCAKAAVGNTNMEKLLTAAHITYTIISLSRDLHSECCVVFNDNLSSSYLYFDHIVF